MEIPELPEWLNKASVRIRQHIKYLREAAFYWQHEAEDLRAALAAMQNKLPSSFCYFLPNESETAEPRRLPDDITLYIRLAEGSTYLRIYKPVDAPHKVVISAGRDTLQIRPRSLNSIEIIPEKA